MNGSTEPAGLADAMGHGLYLKGLDGQITWGNDAAEQITGLPRGASDDGTVSGATGLVRPDGSPLPLDELPSQVAVRTGRPVRNRIIGIRTPGSGERHWIQVSAVPHRDDDGTVVGAIVTFEDVTAVRSAIRHHQRQQRAGRRATRAGRAAMRALEDAVLPRTLPEIPGAVMAARYQPAASAAALGGDWYDAIALPDGSALVNVGDVAGHGIEAVGLMNVLRNAIRLLAALDPEPGRIVSGLRRLMADQYPSAYATVAIAHVAPDTGTLRCVTAGHLPPVIRRATGEVVPLMASATQPALGICVAGVVPATTTELDEGDALVLFTDGLIERRAEPLDIGYRRLEHQLARSFPAAEDLADATLRQLPPDGHDDDVCVLVLQRTA